MEELSPISNGAILEVEEAWTRICVSAKAGTITAVYELGTSLLQEATERVKAIESKAISLAAYGTAIVTLLVSSSSFWIKLGNTFSAWIAVLAGISALVCTGCCIGALSLRPFSAISQEDWLKRKYLENTDELKKYWTLNVWRVHKEQIELQAQKAKWVRQGQIWLAAAVVYLSFFLFHITAVFNFRMWLRNVHSPSHNVQWRHYGYVLTHFWGGWGTILICGSGFVIAIWRSGLGIILWHRLASVGNRIKAFVLS